METPELAIEEFVLEVGKLPPHEDELFIACTMRGAQFVTKGFVRRKQPSALAFYMRYYRSYIMV